MVSDITGFTKLTEILSHQGSTGIELLTKCINNFFEKVCSHANASIGCWRLEPGVVRLDLCVPCH